LYPLAPKFLIGFSCGGNLAVNYIASMVPNPFIATVSISNGYDIWKGVNLLKSDWVADSMSNQFLKSMLTPACVKQLSDDGVDVNVLIKTKSLSELDKLLILPIYNYSNLRDYYDDDSCHTKLKHVKTPLLCIGCLNDPIVDASLTQIPTDAAKTNPNIINVVTEHGGHIGWYEGRNREQWSTKLYFEYVNSFLNDL